jgi:3-methylfumaryl-CoA hydratase
MSTISIDTLAIGDSLPERAHTPTNVSLFLYNAAIWNAHRIHYDESYSVNVEGHPGVVIDGPLQGDWLAQTVVNWLGESGSMVELEYSNRRASHLGDTVYSGGKVTAVDRKSHRVEIDIFVKNEAGDVLSPGHAVVQLDQ